MVICFYGVCYQSLHIKKNKQQNNKWKKEPINQTKKKPLNQKTPQFWGPICSDDYGISRMMTVLKASTVTGCSKPIVYWCEGQDPLGVPNFFFLSAVCLLEVYSHKTKLFTLSRLITTNVYQFVLIFVDYLSI